MSRITVTGSLPSAQQLLGILDAHAKDAMTQARDIARDELRDEAPGRLGDAITGSVRKTPHGYRATVAPPRKQYHPPGEATVAQVVRWVNRGTGTRRVGPGPKKPITGKRGVLRPMVLPGGKKVRSVKGQAANPFVARAAARAEPRVRAAIEQTARHAADRLRRSS